jgi:predicted DCC family thiol-disulfide oxidoreductase YuxK
MKIWPREREMTDKDHITIVYDDQCPVCRTYCAGLKPQADGPALDLVDARQGGALMDEITARGLDIDQGMVVKIGDTLHYGSDAIHELSKYAGTKNAMGVMGRVFFGSRFIARIVYPPCKAVRNVLLRMLGISKVGNLKKRR